MSLETLSELMQEELRDLYNAEHQLLKALPKMAKKASSRQLRDAFNGHLKETQGHVDRLDEIARILGVDLAGKTCKAMEGLVKEGGEALEEDGPDAVVDANLIGAARRVEHYEMAAYGTTRGMAEQLGHDAVAELLEETMNEEKAADDKLKGIAKEEVFPQAAEADESEAGSGRGHSAHSK